MDAQRPLSAVDLSNDDIPEETEDLTDSPTAILSPPARIAARFYRPPATRRKSSATSSRRNSLTSNHSQLSNSSYRQACRNNHVAQYLRRASIIESRKNRLAAREAHAEQVRLRAALAKSAPRASNSEERALAAQQAREVRLAQIAATCAEEVRRAKKKAEDIKEKRAAEEERYRLEMEEKHAEAERRRLQYQRTPRGGRPRTASTPPNVGGLKKPSLELAPVMDRDMAVSTIQRAWRSARRRRVLDEFSRLGMTIDQVAGASLDDVREKLLDDHVLSVTKQVLELFGLYNIDEAARNGPAASMAIQAPTRNFLTTYLLLSHPNEVLSKDGEQEKDLIQKAKELILAFEDALTKTSSSRQYKPDPTQLEDLHLAHNAYLTAFEDWKTQDSTMFVEIMVASFVHLDAIWQSVKDDTAGAVADDYRDGIRENQLQLYTRIRKMVGKDRTDIMIKKAIKEGRRRRLRRKPVGDVRPRVALDASIHPSKADGSEPMSITAETTSHLGPPTPEASDEGPNKAISRLFSVLPDNRVLTHELAIDKEYTIDLGPHSDLRDALNRKLCEEMLHGFENGDGDAWTVAMVQNIRSKLLHLLGGARDDSPTKRQIADVLDPDLVAQQCVQGMFSYEKFFTFMATLLPKLCAPFRDEEVKLLSEELVQQGANTAEMIQKLAKLLRMIDLFSLDYSNYLLKAVAPRLIQESAGYEARRFAESLDKGEIILRRTKRWWKNAHVNCVTEIDRSDPHSSGPTAQRIYARGLVDLAIASGPMKDSEYPETLDLDKQRIARTRADAVRITIIGAILLTAKNLLKRDVRAQWKPESARLWTLFKDGYASPSIDEVASKALSILESSKPMPSASKSQLLSIVTRMLPQASTGKFTDPVVKVLFQRLRSHIFSRLAASSSGERVRQATGAGEGLAKSGFAEFIGHVGELVDLLGRVGEVDRRSHGMWYEKVAAEVEALGDGAELSRSTTEGSGEDAVQ